MSNAATSLALMQDSHERDVRGSTTLLSWNSCVSRSQIYTRLVPCSESTNLRAWFHTYLAVQDDLLNADGVEKPARVVILTFVSVSVLPSRLVWASWCRYLYWGKIPINWGLFDCTLVPENVLVLCINECSLGGGPEFCWFRLDVHKATVSVIYYFGRTIVLVSSI